jgi:hypothetical protein
MSCSRIIESDRAGQRFLVSVLAPLVVGVVEFLSESVHTFNVGELCGVSDLGKCHVGDNDNVQCGGSVLLDAGITAGVVLVRAGSSVLLPGLTVWGFGHRTLRRGAGGRAGYKE